MCDATDMTFVYNKLLLTYLRTYLRWAGTWILTLNYRRHHNFDES